MLKFFIQFPFSFFIHASFLRWGKLISYKHFRVDKYRIAYTI